MKTYGEVGVTLDEFLISPRDKNEQSASRFGCLTASETTPSAVNVFIICVQERMNDN